MFLTWCSRITKGEDWQCTSEVRAHGGEITDIAAQPHDEACLIASSGKDRMIQLFSCTEDSFDLVQTMDDHVAAVSNLLFVNDGERLLSSSADRTVIIRDRLTRESEGEITAAFIISKVIRLKSSPISMAVLPDDPDSLVLSTIDRQVHKYDIPSARHIHSFRTADSEPSDAVVMGSLSVQNGTAGQCPSLLIGVSTTDKSIRIYDFEKDMLLAREFGHTEGVSDVMVHQRALSSPCDAMKKMLISTGLDGVIMIWRLSVEHVQSQPEAPQSSTPGDDTPSKEPTAARPPMRRILSRGDLAGFQKPGNPSSPSPTPTRDRSPPRLRKKTSRLTLAHSAKNGNNFSTSTSPLTPARQSPTSPFHPRNRRERSTSPPSPRTPGPSRSIATRSSGANLRRPSMDFRSRQQKSRGTTPNNSELGGLNMSTEQVCRALRAYRKKLSISSDHLQAATELEEELKLTTQALGRHSKRAQSSEDSSDSNVTVKSSESKRATVPAATTKSLPRHLARRMPSTPNLGQVRKERRQRTNSLKT